MLTTLLAILPIFAMIGLGFAGRRSGTFGPTAHRELSRFVVKLALPALMFAIMAETKPALIWQPGFILVFGGGAILILLLTLLIRRCMAAEPGNAVIESLAASYPNAAFIGIPLALALFGARSLLFTSIASILTICLLFALAILLMEMTMQTGAGFFRSMTRAFASAGRNPMVYMPAAGALFSFGGLTLPDTVRHFVDLLGASASPCALVALGLFLGEKRAAVPAGPVAQIVVIKLLVQPAVTWLIAFPLLGLPPLWAKGAVLIAALPTGTGPFMLSELYDRDADVTARVILISTLVSIGTLTVLMTIL
jgi:malonate transporter